MITAIITDTHFGARNDSTAFSNYFARFYNDIFFPYLKKHDIKHVIHMGDVFDRRKFINYKTLYDARNYFFNPLRDNGLQCWMLAGNHDTFYKTTNEVSSVGLLLQEYDNIQVFDTAVEMENCVLMPWVCSGNYDESINLIKNTKQEVMFGHFEIDGFEMIRGQFCSDGLPRQLFEKFDMVFSGHFHHKSDNGTVYYTGNPYQTNWLDYKDPRGFHIFNFDNRELTFVQNPYEMFHKFFYNDVDWTLEEVNEMDFDEWQQAYVKIVVENKTNPFFFDIILDKMYKSGVGNINVVESFAELDDGEDIVDEAQDTISILSTYIDSLETNVDKKRLDLLMRSLYNESLTLE